MTRVLVGAVCVSLFACNAVMPLDKKPDAGADASEQQDAGQNPDGTLINDGPKPDGPIPDSSLPDTWPWFDGGTTNCAKLWVSPEIVTISKEKDSVPGTSPTIVADDLGTFYIAFVEDKKVWVRGITPLDPTEKMKLETSQQLSKGTLEAVNPWLVNGNAKLAAVWTEKNPQGSYSCASKPMFTEFSATQAALTVTDLTKDAIRGFDPITMVYDKPNNRYVLTAALQWSGVCNNHVKGSHHNFPSGAPTPFAPTIHFDTATWFPTVALTGSTTTPFAMLRLYGPDYTPQPGAVLQPMLYTSANGTNWSSAFTSPPKDAFPLRPALIGDGTAVWMAWTFDDTSSSQTGPTVKVVRRTIVGTTTPLEAPVPKLSRHPFFARRGDLIALVYSKLDGTGTPMDIELAQVTYAGDTTPALTIAAGLGLSGATSASPDKPVVASGKNGFGVAWQEKVNGVDEVRFRWVGCRP